MQKYEKTNSPETDVESTLTAGTNGKSKRYKNKSKCVFTLTEVNVTKGTTPYLSPEPVLVPHSQLHGCE